MTVTPFREIILFEDEYSDATKARTVTVYKKELTTDINAITFKFSNRAIEGTVARDMVAADTKDNLDGTILNRFMDYRDAEIRRKMKFAIAVEDVDQADDTMRLAENYVYNFVLNEKFNDSTLEAVARLIHRYIVYGTLYDWFLTNGIGDQAANYKAELKGIEDELIDNLRTPSRVKKPLQPFGPRRKGGDYI